MDPLIAGQERSPDIPHVTTRLMSLANLTVASEGPQKETFQPPLFLFSAL